jgi:hypothetical protein
VIQGTPGERVREGEIFVAPVSGLLVDSPQLGGDPGGEGTERSPLRDFGVHM